IRFSVEAQANRVLPTLTNFPSGRNLLLVLCLFVLVLFIGSTRASATTYYLSPSGSDSNNGTSTSYSWLSPNHSLNCGDVIIAAAGTYNNANFYTGKWGTVSCHGNNNV